MKFLLEIELGNDAMQTKGDISAAVSDALTSFTDRYDLPVAASSGTIRDWNGNTVGKWEVRAEPGAEPGGETST